MPPRSSLNAASFSSNEPAQEVVCPLKNNDGSTCRKRCFGEKRYRSMQEHIRRAHPEHYISKLPATEESFLQMINTSPSQRPLHDQHPQNYSTPSPSMHSIPFPRYRLTPSQDFINDANAFYSHNHSSPTGPHHPHAEARRPSFVPTANAAAALAQLHNSRPESDWDVDRVRFPQILYSPDSEVDLDLAQDAFNDPDNDHGFPAYFSNSDPQAMFGDSQAVHDSSHGTSNNLLPAHFPPTSSSRATSLQPFPRKPQNRPRKSSITENARRPKHERQRSRDQKRLSHDRKAFSAEPVGVAALTSKRWEDLLDAAASATEEDSRDLTPVSSLFAPSPISRSSTHSSQIPASPRGSMPPYQGHNHSNQFHSYNTSPLQNAILPEPSESQQGNYAPPLEAFPSVESSFDQQGPQTFQHHQHNSSNDSSLSNPFGFPRPTHQQQSSSGSNFHIPTSGLSSSPNDPLSASAMSRGHHMHSHSWSQPSMQPQMQSSQMPSGAGLTQAPPPQQVQHYCAACHRIAALNASYACTECICGICRDCVDVLLSMGPDRGARCPRCGIIGSRFKPFMLDLR